MKIKSNKRLLHLISNHEVGIIYPNLIPYMACNIVTQRDDSIFKSYGYCRFAIWFYWAKTKEGHDFWDKIRNTLHTVNNENV